MRRLHSIEYCPDGMYFPNRRNVLHCGGEHTVKENQHYLPSCSPFSCTWKIPGYSRHPWSHSKKYDLESQEADETDLSEKSWILGGHWTGRWSLMRHGRICAWTNVVRRTNSRSSSCTSSSDMVERRRNLSSLSIFFHIAEGSPEGIGAGIVMLWQIQLWHRVHNFKF